MTIYEQFEYDEKTRYVVYMWHYIIDTSMFPLIKEMNGDLFRRKYLLVFDGCARSI